MTDPLIVVEGNLRLPPTRPLADPRLKFGSEWTSARSRPVQSKTEVPLYAARLETAYVEAVSLYNPDSPYRALSIWAVFAKGEMRQSMLRLTQGHGVDETADHFTGHIADESAVEPIPLTVRDPVTAPAQASHRWPRSMKTAIALACAGLIAWLLFGQEHRVEDKTPVAVKPDSEPGMASESTPTAGSSIAATAASQPVAVAVEPAVVAPVASQPVVSQPVALPEPVAVAVKPVAASANSGKVVDKTTNGVPVARVVERAPQSRVSSKQSPKQAEHASRATAERPAYASKHHASAGYASVSSSIGMTTARTTSARRHEYTPITSAAHSAPARSASVVSRNARAGNSLDTRALYDMLQHSPTLDNNVSAGVSQASAQ